MGPIVARFLVVFGVLFCDRNICHGKPIDALNYLEKYGYYGKNTNNKNVFTSQLTISDAIKEFQKFAGLNETGKIDNDTLAKMNEPRCGVRDKTSSSVLFASSKPKWNKNHLTYYINNSTNDLNTTLTEMIIKKAFQHWEDVTPLSFAIKNDISADIIITFASGDHGDGFPFDGKGKTLAHAFAPQNGDVHFDDDETFTDGVSHGTNLLWVAVHEIGHALGLSHSNVKGSIMNAFYGGYIKDFKLHTDDITRIQNIYGNNMRMTTTTKKPSPVNCNDDYPTYLCNAWKNGGYCAINYRVKTGCKKTCNSC